MRRLGAGALALACALLLGGCAISPNAEPHALPASQDPLIVVNTAPSTTIASGTSRTVPLRVYYFLDGTLQSVIRTVAEPFNTLSELDLALVLVSEDPTASEVREGITTYFSPLERQAPTVLSIDKGVATVDLDGSFNLLSGTELANAMAQIIFTITAVPNANIHAVTFMLNGVVFPGYSPSGRTLQPPLTRADYAALATTGD